MRNFDSPTKVGMEADISSGTLEYFLLMALLCRSCIFHSCIFHSRIFSAPLTSHNILLRQHSTVVAVEVLRCHLCGPPRYILHIARVGCGSVILTEAVRNLYTSEECEDSLSTADGMPCEKAVHFVEHCTLCSWVM